MKPEPMDADAIEEAWGFVERGLKTQRGKEAMERLKRELGRALTEEQRYREFYWAVRHDVEEVEE